MHKIKINNKSLLFHCHHHLQASCGKWKGHEFRIRALSFPIKARQDLVLFLKSISIKKLQICPFSRSVYNNNWLVTSYLSVLRLGFWWMEVINTYNMGSVLLMLRSSHQTYQRLNPFSLKKYEFIMISFIIYSTWDFFLIN